MERANVATGMNGWSRSFCAELSSVESVNDFGILSRDHGHGMSSNAIVKSCGIKVGINRVRNEFGERRECRIKSK